MPGPRFSDKTEAQKRVLPANSGAYPSVSGHSYMERLPPDTDRQRSFQHMANGSPRLTESRAQQSAIHRGHESQHSTFTPVHSHGQMHHVLGHGHTHNHTPTPSHAHTHPPVPSHTYTHTSGHTHPYPHTHPPLTTHSAQASASPSRPGTGVAQDPIYSFGQKMMRPEAENAFSAIRKPGSRLGLLSGLKDAGHEALRMILGDTRKYEEAASGAARQVYDILGFIQSHHKLDDFLNNDKILSELFELLESSMGNLEPAANLALESLHLTSPLPYWGIIVEVLLISRDGVRLYHRIGELRRIRAIRQRGSGLDEHQYSHAKKELNKGIYNLSKHTAKFALKTASAAGVTVPVTKPLELLISLAQISKGVGTFSYNLASGRKEKNLARRVGLTEEVIGMGRRAFQNPQYPPFYEQARHYLEILNLNNSKFYQTDAKGQVMAIFNAIA